MVYAASIRADLGSLQGSVYIYSYTLNKILYLMYILYFYILYFYTIFIVRTI